MSQIKQFLPQNRKGILIWIGLILLVFVIGLSLNNGESKNTHDHQSEEAATQVSAWTCSMHPQIQQPKPGDCPICGMDLIPVSQGDDGDQSPRSVKLSANARKLAEVETAPVQRKFVEHKIRMVGKIDYDETQLSYITAWVPGRIDRLYVNYTGISVKKGDHLAELYSPELLSTQRELIESVKALKSMNNGGFASLKDETEQQLQLVRERLRLWGLTKKQISNIEKRQEPSDHMTIYSPVSGVVVHKEALQGKYVDTGTRIYTIADLQNVWVQMDAYEADIPWLRYGQIVEFTTESYPGETFTGKIAFIDPLLESSTRTVKVRVNVKNPERKLKPGMFVRAEVSSRISKGGKVMEPSLAGKWISPMHPEVVKDHPGNCDVCGMPLVRAEELGYVSAEASKEVAPLVIPASAPLVTGKRAVVYVEDPEEPGIYEGREIELGPRAGEYYLVKSGLKEGERVVVKGNFKIDSAIQIKAGPSMMSPDGGTTSSGHQHAHGNQSQKSPEKGEKKSKQVVEKHQVPQDFVGQLDNVYDWYFKVQYALSHDDFSSAQEHTENLLTALGKVDMKLLKGDSHNTWMDLLKGIKSAGEKIKNASDIKSARQHFEMLSINIIQAAKAFGSEEHNLLVYHCPMAFDNKGADWLQDKEGTENPYFGSAMFKCGSQTADLTADDLKKKHEGHSHE